MTAKITTVLSMLSEAMEMMAARIKIITSRS